MSRPRQRILVVDDMPSNINVLNLILKDDYAVSAARSGPDALRIAGSETPPDLILLDVMMPGMDGYEVCRRLKADPSTRGIPVLFVTAMADNEDETRGLEAGGVDYLTKPVSPPVVLARVRNHMQLKLHQNHLELLVAQRTRELAITQEVTIQSLASLAETRDNETGGHIMRTQRYVEALGRHLLSLGEFPGELSEESLSWIHKSAPLHDIGKVGVPDAILLKPGKLTPDEFETMKLHTVYGKEAISRAEKLLGTTENSFLAHARDIAYSHHERWDGKGYPRGLSGPDIPLCGRLMAVADVYDALVSKRVYKSPVPHHKAVSIIAEGRGTQFDPQVADAFLAISETFREIALAFADFEEERQALST
ncbi:MAG: two-component system response regulator [Thermodesulfobacteriota bacterium]